MIVTEDELMDIVAKESIVDRKTLHRDAKLSDLGIESLDVISILFAIEDRYGVVIKDSDMPQAQTLGVISDFLLARINKPAA